MSQTEEPETEATPTLHAKDPGGRLRRCIQLIRKLPENPPSISDVMRDTLEVGILAAAKGTPIQENVAAILAEKP